MKQRFDRYTVFLPRERHWYARAGDSEEETQRRREELELRIRREFPGIHIRFARVGDVTGPRKSACDFIAGYVEHFYAQAKGQTV